MVADDTVVEVQRARVVERRFVVVHRALDLRGHDVADTCDPLYQAARVLARLAAVRIRRIVSADNLVDVPRK